MTNFTSYQKCKDLLLHATSKTEIAFKQSIYISALLIGLASLTNSLSAQNTLELSLNDAVQYALEHNRMMKNATFSIQESQAAYRATIAQGLPQVDATLDYQNFFNSEAAIGPMTFTFDPTSNFNLSVGQLVFSGTYIVGIQMAMLYKDIAKVNYQKTDIEIRTQLMNSYYLVLVSHRMLEILEQNILNIEDVISKTNALVTVGMLDETDRDQIILQKVMLENSMRTAQKQLELSYNLLRMQLGVTATTTIKLTDNLMDILAGTNVNNSLDLRFDLNNNLDFRLMSLQRDMTAKQFSMEKSKFLPTVSAFYNYTEKIKKPELDFAPKNIIGLNVNIPIFSSGKRYYSMTQAKIQLMSMQNQLELVSEQLSIQEKQLRMNLQTAYEQYQLQRNNIELARKVYNNMYVKYSQGVISGLDMTTSNSNLLQAENNYIMSVMQLLESKTAFDTFINNK